jgi:hypothetical protein
MRACARRGAEHAQVAHRTTYRACPVHHQTTRQAHKLELQRSEPNDQVTWLAHRTVSGAPGNSTPNSSPSGIFRGLRYNSLDCPVPQGRATLNSPASGIYSAIIHRTVRCNSGATATSRATVDCNALNARLRAQRSRARAGDTPDNLQGLSGAPPDNQAGPQVRAPTVGTQRSGDVAGAPDSVRWRTGLSGAPVNSSLHQRSSLVVGAINTPTTPHIQVIQVFHLPTTYKS